MLARGCATASVSHVKHDQVHHAYELSNGTIRLVILPQIGRAMWYGCIGQRNVLFDNSTDVASTHRGDYLNWGGDKAWIWPQSSWRMLTGAMWPPPPAMDGRPWQATVTSPRSLRLTSPLIMPWDVRIQRDVSIDDVGARVVWKTRILAEHALLKKQPPPPLASWSITQIAPPDSLRARLVSSSEPSYKKLMDGQWKRIWREGQWLNFTRDPSAAAKVGMDADRFEATFGDMIFTQTLVAGSKDGYQPLERAQIYSQPDPVGDHAKTPAYLEIEFTSPRRVPTKADGPEMTVIWQLTARKK
jgi:hypothetical protein